MFKTFFVQLYYDLYEGFASGASAVWSAVSTWASGIYALFPTWLKNGLDIAGQFIAGLIAGIGAGVGQVVGAIKGLGKSTLKAATDFFKIKSPSKLFERVGYQLPAGQARGIIGGAGLVKRAIGAVGSVALSAATDQSRSASISQRNEISVRLEGSANQGLALGRAVQGALGGANDDLLAALETT
jgi:phage-related protein